MDPLTFIAIVVVSPFIAAGILFGMAWVADHLPQDWVND